MTSLQAEGDHNLGEVETGKKVNGSRKKKLKKMKRFGGEAKAGKAISPRNPIKAGVMEKRRRVLDWNKKQSISKMSLSHLSTGSLLEEEHWGQKPQGL